MKNLIFALFIMVYCTANAQYNVIKIGDQYIYLPVKKEKKKEIEGIGMKFTAPVKVVEETNELGQTTKTISVWVRNCKDIILDDERAKKELKNGDMISFRFTEADSCQIKAWERF